ncbi:DUF2461 family protein [Arthrobacter sp. SX1312]|uniref:DUF2461 family protein n=1 Tax=Arthrobacter sp. SX1312 TaxID=2058896 RepID=UPI0015E22C43|nr:DUF2461 family protein [Arthrobacter sp. SX1312]
MDRPIFDEAQSFFARLEADNTREFWARQRRLYDVGIRPVFAAVCAALTVFSDWRIYRPHNDVRFRPDSPPYKTFIGAVAERPDGVGAFLRVSSIGLLVATGLPLPAPDQLAAFRAAVADDVAGPALVAAIGTITARGMMVRPGRAQPLKRVPRGYPADHPRADLLRWKGIEVNHRVRRPVWTDVASASSGIDELLREPAALHEWLARYVGASALTAEQRFGPRRGTAAP